MSVEPSTTTEQSNSTYDTELVETASRFISKVLRHGLEDDPACVNSRGWMSCKTIRMLLQKNIKQEVNCRKLLDDVLDADTEDRFQVIEQDPFKMIRARYGHTQDHVQLYDISVDKSKQTDYIVSLNNGVEDAYVSAVNKDIAKQIFIERHLNDQSLGQNKISVTETETITLSGRNTPFTHYRQDESGDTTVRCNVMGVQNKYLLTNRRNNIRRSNK